MERIIPSKEFLEAHPDFFADGFFQPSDMEKYQELEAEITKKKIVEFAPFPALKVA